MSARLVGTVLGGVALALASCTPSPPEDLDRLRARNAVLEDRHDWARIYFRRDYERHPERIDSRRREGLAWLSGYQRSLGHAVLAFRDVLDREPEDQETRRHLVGALLALGRTDEAEAALEGLDDDPRSLALRAEAVAESDPEAAASLLERAVGSNSPPPGAHALAARVYDRQRRPEEVVRHATAAIREAPLRPEPHYLKARAYRATKQVEEADETLATWELVSELTEQGATSARSPEERLELLARLRGRIPFEHVDFSRLEADILFALGASAQAHDRISRLAAEGDFDADALLDLANKAETLGWRRLARSLVAAAAERDPDHPGVRSSRAILAISEGHLDDAERLLREDLARDPDRARTHRLLSQVHAARDETEAALRHGRRAVELAPWQEDWRALLVELLDSLGHGAEARRVREGAPRPEPTS